MLTRINESQQQHDLFQRQLLQLDERQRKLLDAIEKGVVDIDELTQQRMQEIKLSRDALKIELASVVQKPNNVESLGVNQIEMSSDMLKNKLLKGDKEVARNYLHLLVDEVRVTNNLAVISGGVEALFAAAKPTYTFAHIK